MVTIDTLFEIHKGKSYFKDFSTTGNCLYDYITTSGENNGIKCTVEKNIKYTLFEPETITVAMQGSVLSTFVQFNYFYLQTHVAALIPKVPMTLKEKIYYSLIIHQHAYRFNFGRKANTTLGQLEIPSLEEIPAWVNDTEMPNFDYIKEAKNQDKVALPDFNQWKIFKLVDLFDIHRGNGAAMKDAKANPGLVPYIGSSATNNGVTANTSLTPTEEGNCITISGDGSIGYAFYQPKSFMALTNVNILIPKFELNASRALFFCTLFGKNREKYNYGRKLGLTRIKEETISLPINEQGEPDWQLMENYINSLPYSATL